MQSFNFTSSADEYLQSYMKLYATSLFFAYEPGRVAFDNFLRDNKESISGWSNLDIVSSANQIRHETVFKRNNENIHTCYNDTKKNVSEIIRMAILRYNNTPEGTSLLDVVHVMIKSIYRTVYSDISKETNRSYKDASISSTNMDKTVQDYLNIYMQPADDALFDIYIYELKTKFMKEYRDTYMDRHEIYLLANKDNFTSLTLPPTSCSFIIASINNMVRSGCNYLYELEVTMLECEMMNNLTAVGIEAVSVTTSSNQCSVCLNFMRTDDTLVKTSCGHIFHINCINIWLYECGTLNKTCPMCRSSL